MSNRTPDEASAVPVWRRYLRFRGTDVRADIADELEFHIEMIASRLVAEGAAPDEARARARREFGDIERARQLCEGIGSERERRREWAELVDSVRHDIRFALRGLARSPGFAIAIILILALGIGSSTAIFSIVRGILLRPLPLPNRIAWFGCGRSPHAATTTTWSRSATTRRGVSKPDRLLSSAPIARRST